MFISVSLFFLSVSLFGIENFPKNVKIKNLFELIEHFVCSKFEPRTHMLIKICKKCEIKDFFGGIHYACVFIDMTRLNIVQKKHV